MRKSMFALGAVVVSALGVAGVSYQDPPRQLTELLLARPPQGVQFDDKLEWALLTQSEGAPSVELMARPAVSLAALQIDPANFAPSVAEPVVSIALKNLRSGREHAVEGLPADLRANHVSWSPDYKKVALLHTRRDAVDLYVIDVASQRAARVNRQPLNAVFSGGADHSQPYQWLDDERLVYAAVTAAPSQAPAPPLMPAGPRIEDSGESAGETSSAHTRALFEFYGTSQLIVNRRGEEKKLGDPDLYTSLSASPDGRYVLARVVHKPAAPEWPYYSMPCDLVVLEASGAARRRIARLGTQQELIRTFAFDWRSDEPATLYWFERANDGATRVLTLVAPFEREPAELVRTTGRLQRLVWGAQSIWLEELRNRSFVRVSLLDRSGAVNHLFEGPQHQRVVPLTVRNDFGRQQLAVRKKGAKILAREPGSTDITELDVATGKRAKIVVDGHVQRVLDADRPVVLTTGSDKAGRTFALRDLSSTAPPRTLLRLPDATPRVQAIVQKVSYQRADGLPLTGMLFLPAGYDARRDGPLPVFMWSYPIRFESAAAVSQYEGSATPHEESLELSSWELPLAWVTQGYAVFEPHMPIVPTEGHPNGNDTFTQQLCMNAQAAIDKLADMRVGDRDRVAVGGHSYGASMTASLLAHCGALFKAGIAMSGDYNHTMTPFGFQDETRTYWQAPDLYRAVSPFAFADRIKTPLLLIHGEMDSHPGTAPLHSKLLFDAVKAAGGTARYVSLPFEDHGFRGRESLLHVYWEMHRWLDKYLKASNEVKQ